MHVDGLLTRGYNFFISNIFKGVRLFLKNLFSFKLKKNYFLSAICLFGCLVHSAFGAGPGSTGAVELKIPVGPRAIAMGQAFVAVADDASAVYWNPAGLNQAGGTHLMLEYNVFIETVQYSGGDLVMKLNKDFALGLGAKLLTTGQEAEVNGSGVTTGNFFSESYMDLDLAGALHLSYYFDIGMTAKYISKNLAGTTASTVAVDLGLLYRTPIPHFTAGLNLQNLGPGLKFATTPDPLPLNLKMGVAYKMFNDDFTVAYDVNFPNDNAIATSLGGEYWYKDTLVGRFGYQFQGSIDQNDLGIGGKAGLYLGAGVKVAFSRNFYLGLDYAWTDQGFLGANHHFAVDAYF
jgi:long-subunit fatty acid transport protein